VFPELPHGWVTYEDQNKKNISHLSELAPQFLERQTIGVRLLLAARCRRGSPMGSKSRKGLWEHGGLMRTETPQKVLEKLATSDKATIVVERLLNGNMRVTSGSWDGEKVILRDQVLEVRNVDGRLHIARKPREYDEWGPACAGLRSIRSWPERQR
jgi:hypothetical protein